MRIPISHSTSTAAEAISALVALAVILAAVTVGGAAQPDPRPTGASAAEEPNDTLENATRVDYGEDVDATLSSPSDVDYYALNATAGDAIVPRLHLENTFDGSAIAVDIVTPSGEVATELSNDQINGPQNVAGENRPIDARDTAYTADVMESDGTYYVRVSEAPDFLGGGETNESDVYRYNLTVNTTDLDEYDPNEDGTTATRIELNETVEAVMTGYDSDVYAVNVTAGQSYRVTVETPGSDLEKQLIVYDDAADAVDDPDYEPNGSSVAHDELFFEGSVGFTADENGTYYVQLLESSVNPSLLQRANYSLAVASADRDGDGLPNARELEFGTDPTNPDTDGDGLTDGREAIELGTDPLSDDTDGDGRTDDCELRNGTDPTDPGTDADSTPDGEAV